MMDRFLFFPFSHITKVQLKTLQAFFSSFDFLPVTATLEHDPELRDLAEKGLVTPIFLPEEKLQPIETQVRAYMEWVKIHKGNEHNLRLLLKDNPYYTSDSDVTSIKSALLGRQKKARIDEQKESTEVRDLMFLKMAHLCDEQHEDIDRELESLDRSREQLFSTLQGIEPEPSPTEPEPAEKTDTGQIMTRERIRAWAGVMRRSGVFESSGSFPLLVTTSPAVFDYLETNSKEIVIGLDIDTIKVHEGNCAKRPEWQEAFGTYLAHRVSGDGDRKDPLPDASDGCSVTGQVTLGFFSGDEINQLFKMSNKQVAVCLVRLK